jgi:hypothetical protein
MRLGNAIPQISVIQAARLSAGEIFSIINRVYLNFIHCAPKICKPNFNKIILETRN